MFCTGKEQLTCNSEKMGCEGCFYENEQQAIEILRKEIEKLKRQLEVEKNTNKNLNRECQRYSDIIMEKNIEEANKMRKFEIVKNEYRKFKDEEITIPKRGTVGSAAYDFYTPCDIVIPAKGRTGIIATDIKAKMEEDEVLLLFVRSSIGIKKGIVLSNGTGVIDSSYYSNPDNDGNIGVSLLNTTDEEVIIKKGDRIMQGMFVKYLITEDDNATEERKSGFGSTGK